MRRLPSILHNLLQVMQRLLSGHFLPRFLKYVLLLFKSLWRRRRSSTQRRSGGKDSAEAQSPSHLINHRQTTDVGGSPSHEHEPDNSQLDNLRAADTGIILPSRDSGPSPVFSTSLQKHISSDSPTMEGTEMSHLPQLMEAIPSQDHASVATGTWPNLLNDTPVLPKDRSQTSSFNGVRCATVLENISKPRIEPISAKSFRRYDRRIIL